MLTVNIFSRAAELGLKLNTKGNKRLKEITLDPKKISLGELAALSKKLKIDGRELIGESKARRLGRIDLKEMDEVIAILKGEQ